jgi:hypothetical protein
MATTTSSLKRGRTKPTSGGMLDGRASRLKAGRGRPSSRGLVVLAALLVLGFALATAYLVTRAGDKISVLSVGTPITKGHVIERADLVSLAVSGIAGAVPVEHTNDVVGKTATVDLVKGQVLTEDMITTTPTPATGHATVGLALDPTRVPSSGLDPGDIVDVIAVPNSEASGNSGGGVGGPATSLDNPTVLARAATVYAVEGLATDGGKVLLTVVVDTREAGPVAAYSTSDRVAVVEVAAGGGQ